MGKAITKPAGLTSLAGHRLSSVCRSNGFQSCVLTRAAAAVKGFARTRLKAFRHPSFNTFLSSVAFSVPSFLLDSHQQLESTQKGFPLSDRAAGLPGHDVHTEAHQRPADCHRSAPQAKRKTGADGSDVSVVWSHQMCLDQWIRDPRLGSWTAQSTAQLEAILRTMIVLVYQGVNCNSLPRLCVSTIL